VTAIDEQSLQQTVDLLKLLNPGRVSASAIRRRVPTQGYCSSAGWIAYHSGDKNNLIRFAIEPYGVIKYLSLSERG
jgi:hypothetical protein